MTIAAAWPSNAAQCREVNPYLVLLSVRIGAGGEQGGDDLDVASASRQVQGGESVLAHFVRARAGVEQGGDGLGVASIGRPVQRCGPFVVLPVRASAGAEKGEDGVEIAFLGGGE